MQLELLKPHTHTGIAYPPGAVLALDDDLAQWLVDAGIARAVSQPATVPPTLKPVSRNEEKSK
jgi:hypothetical protein